MVRPSFRKKIRCTLAPLALLLVALSPASAAENVVPERRLAITQNMDFYGADLQPVFETTFDTCMRICLADSACRAFTFNFKANSCFPKSDISERVPFEGAASAQVFDTDAKVLARQGDKLQKLGFLPERYLREARDQAARLAQDYITNQWTTEQLIEASRNARSAGNHLNALRFMGAALNLSDAADGWAEMAALALEVKTEKSSDKRDMQRIASAAAINAYLRSANKGLEVTALNTLARAVEQRGSGRLAISVLRLAQSIAPRLDTEDALTRLIGLYGFRITEHSVDNNAAQPRVCAQFSEALVAAGVNYGDFVRLPDSGMVVEAEGNQLCIDGVRHGERYRLTFREGLPAQSGEKLIKSVDLDLYIKDRDPSARFVGRAYVLPRGAEASIPIVTVNLSEVDLAIHRVGERNLVRTIEQGYFNAPLSLWDENNIRDDIGEEVWSGKGIVAREVNRDVTTALPIGDAVASFEPGVYVLSARVPGADPWVSSAAAQWFIVTDLGLATLSGGDGLHVFVRGLGDAVAKPGVKVRLVARNNEVLGEAFSDAMGYARFAPGLTRGEGARAPSMVTAADEGGDFAFLDLKSAAFDLSDRGVGGRVSPPPMDVFLTTDRGAYRAGETVYATALARDGKAEAIEGLPLTAIILRPDGVEFSRELLDDAGAGGRVFAVHLPNAAQRGAWNIRLHADVDAPALVAQKFLVEDLIPERIDFTLSLPDGPVRVADVPMIDLEARYLYGAPGSGLKVEAEARISPAPGLDGYPGYHFGRATEYFGTRLEFTGGDIVTDAKGHVRFGLAMPDLSDAQVPLQLKALVRVAEGSGRPVERLIEAPLAPAATMIGVKPLFDDVVPEGGTAAFDLLAVGTDLQRVGLPKVGWTLSRVRTRYQWYESYGNWNYEPVTTRTRIASGEVALGTGDPVRIEAGVDWGRYELKLETLEGDYIAAAHEFYAGWYAPAESVDTPDTLELALDRDGYLVGDTARLRIVPRYAGTALVTVMSNRLIAMKSVEVTEGENLIDLEVTEDWGAGAYVSASVIRPMNVAAGRNPARSLGLNWASVDPGAHRLTARFLGPDEVSPRTTMTASLQVEGVAPGDTAYATIAAVDLGILNLTGFKSPDPDGHYFGQQRLGMDIRDMYGRLIDGMQGAPGQVRSGGDGPLGDRLQSPPPTEELVAYFSGPLVVGADGMVSADFDIPEFNGTIRLMAVVWSETGVGQAEKDVLARDPVVLTASLPRFLAPYDESRVLLELAHAKGPAGKVGIEVAANGGLYLDTARLPGSVTLADQGRATLSLPIAAPASGTPEITVTLTTPDGERLTKTLILPIRALDPEISRTARVALAAGDTFRLDSDVFASYLPGTGRASLAVGPVARFDAPGLLSALDRYPYGCTEQITSKALPLLYFEQVATSMGLAGKKNVRTRIEQAIGEVLSNQSSSGSFGLWSPGSGDLWLDAYVSDFLSRARAKGFDVPAQAFRLAMDNIRNRVNYAGDFENGGEDIAYALMVMAREGTANIGDLRYYADTKSGDFATPLALAQLGTALAFYGDQMRADAMFRQAGARLDEQRARAEEQLWRVDYGTNLRDTAAVLTLAVEAGSAVLDQPALAARIAPDNMVDRYRSTQENMWSLLAANALIEDTAPDAFLINGSPANGPVVEVLDAQTGGNRQVEVTNNSGRDSVTVLTTFGIPAEPEPAGGNGYFIDRFYFTMDGKPVTPAQVTLNQRLVVVVKVSPSRYSEARLIVNDPLPAGFEIDNPNLLQSGDVKALDWLQLGTEPQHAEFRAERFVAAVDWSSKEAFQLAYVVRAISPGTFRHPAASVEDMYRPEYRARTGVGRVTISE
ncbi:MAG: alpha-2-macroglobulin family protein [Rhodobacteraceae bacterium]|nr:alpha-2-macroglobulin family protein [Paracoccaceae bacterium]